MKSKNPILNFRTKSDSNPATVVLKEHTIKNGFHDQNIMLMAHEPRLAATLVTRSREAADMSENS